MRPYGNTRQQNGTCVYGCCTLGTVKGRRGPHVSKIVIRRSRKAARQRARKESAPDPE